MRLVIDANILVAEAVRRRGRNLLAHSLLDLFVAEPAWNEAQHEVRKRLTAMERYGHITADERREIEDAAQAAVAVSVRQVPHSIYASVEAIARERIPRDPDDWPTVALALVLDGSIWTHDTDFLGCGVPTWTVETLTAHVRRHVPFAFTHNVDLDRNIDYGSDDKPIGVELLGVSQGVDLTDLPCRAQIARLLADAHLPGWDEP